MGIVFWKLAGMVSSCGNGKVLSKETGKIVWKVGPDYSLTKEFDSVWEWPQRGEWAWRNVAALTTDVVVHLGDLREENAVRPLQPESRQRACEQFEQLNISPKHVAGNMDIGDKPDATMWAEWDGHLVSREDAKRNNGKIVVWRPFTRCRSCLNPVP